MDMQSFSFLTEGGLDDVIFVTSGTTSDYGKTIPTPGITERMMLKCAVSQDGVTWYSDRMHPRNGNTIGATLGIEAWSYSGEIKISVFGVGITFPVHYRILGIKP